MWALQHLKVLQAEKHPRENSAANAGEQLAVLLLLGSVKGKDDEL